MKTQILIALFLIIPNMGWAKVDFGSAISESAQEQNTLSASARENAAAVRKVASAPRNRIVVVEQGNTSYASPSGDKHLVKYAKEMKNFAPSEKAKQDRLAQEVHNSGF